MRSILALLAGVATLVATQATALAQQGEITGIEKVYLRSGPSTEDPPLGVLSAGDRVTVLGSAGAWANIQTEDGKIGYVNQRYVSTVAGLGDVEAASVAPTPAATPGQPSEPTPEPTAAVETDALSNELAELRAEVARLKEQVRERKQQMAEEPVTASEEPNSTAAPTSAAPRDQAVGVLAVAGLSLLVGWALGSLFSRRRSRSHRPRLRI